jgi:uncharacterized protein YkwD
MKPRSLISPLVAFVCLLSLLSPVARSSDQPSNPASFLSTAENDLLAEINLARTQPQAYAAYLVEFKKYYQGQRLVLPGKRPIVTFDGERAVDEAIEFLRAARPAPAMEAAEPACSAAKDHGMDLLANGITGHIGSDGTKPNDRVDRYGKWLGGIGEAIVYKVDTARNNVIGLIIDDGNAARGHRNDLFNPDYHYAGVSLSERAANGQVCVIVYVGGFSKKAAQTTNRNPSQAKKQ